MRSACLYLAWHLSRLSHSLLTCLSVCLSVLCREYNRVVNNYADRHHNCRDHRYYYRAVRNGGSRRSYVLLMMFFSRLFQREISELRRPLAAKRCRVIGRFFHFIVYVPKFWGSSPAPPPKKKVGPKTCKIWVERHLVIFFPCRLKITLNI